MWMDIICHFAFRMLFQLVPPATLRLRRLSRFAPGPNSVRPLMVFRHFLAFFEQVLRIFLEHLFSNQVGTWAEH